MEKQYTLQTGIWEDTWRKMHGHIILKELYTYYHWVLAHYCGKKVQEKRILKQ